MKVYAILSILFFLSIINGMIVPALISANDSMLTYAGFFIILVEVGAGINLALKFLKGENK